MTPKEAGKVAVLMGGNSPERDISLNSGAAVLAALQQQGFAAQAIDTAQPYMDLLRDEYQRAFIVVHGIGGEDGIIQGELDKLQMPYTGSGKAASELAFDKAACKDLWRGNGLPTADYYLCDATIDSSRLQQLVPFAFPWAVKPIRAGSSQGISLVQSSSEVGAALRSAAKYDERIMVEQWIQGTEYTAGILHDRVLPLIKLETPRSFYDYTAKYESQDTGYICPCGLDESQERDLASLAMDAFAAAGARGWGRVDFMLDAKGQPYLLELNTVPGMTDHSLVPMAARQHGLSFAKLVVSILASADCFRGVQDVA